MKDSLYISLEKTFENYIHNEKDKALIEKAYFWAKEKHEGQVRKTGEPYITHPVAVAKILAELGAGPNTLIAALLHDVVEDTDATLQDLENMFSLDVAQIVDGVTKLRKLEFKTVHTQAENQQKMLLAMAKDIRVILIKIADRLHNIRTLDAMAPEKQYKIAMETLEIYAPLAHRLGIFRIKAELEDRSLKYVDTEMYYEVSHLIQSKKAEREASIDHIIERIKKLFDENHLNNFSIKGRIKNIYSIYKKMVKNNRSFEDIYDLLAVRIIVDKVENCYQALGLIHATFTPIPRRFKDYIAVPKPNLYQSLHTTVLADDGTLFEVQIRTEEMDKVAEYGVAAHWAYKENKTYSKEKEQFEIAQKLKWYGELLKMSEDTDETDAGAKEFVETVKGDILDANVYVFTPKGEVIELPKGSTPIDFAYRIHTDVGHKMTGALVNNKIVPLDYELNTGDIITIKTSKTAQPSDAWLKIAKSSHAKHKIKAFLNHQNRDMLIENGKLTLERELVANKVTEMIDEAFVKKHFEKNFCQTIEDLYLEIGKGLISPKTVVAKLTNAEVDKEAYLQRQIQKATRILNTHSETGIVVEGLTNPQIKLGNCCFPIPGDDIIGFVSKQSGIVVHTQLCPNVKQLDQNRIVEVFWASNISRKYPALLKIIANTKPTVISDVVTSINSVSVSIAELNSQVVPSVETLLKVKVLVNDFAQLENLIVNIKKNSDVYSVERDYRWD